MKVAVATNNNTTVSQHYGRARHYLVLTVEGGEVVERDVRHRPGSGPEVGQDPTRRSSGDGRSRAAVVADCEALIAGGMGSGAYENLMRAGVKPVLTDERTVDTAAVRFYRGDLPNLMERLHDASDDAGAQQRRRSDL
jgi:predicted Fe-Mo cluster-binding NifX family protein